MTRVILATSFGSFENVGRNASRELAAELVREAGPGVRVVADELPVTFRGAPVAIDALLERHVHDSPAAMLGLGVHKRASFRLERLARGRLEDSERVDNDGVTAAEGAGTLGPDLECTLDLEPLADALQAAGAPEVELSSDAGGYVCERAYHHLLRRGDELALPTVFLHVPPADAMEPIEQASFVRALLPLLGP